MLATNILSFLTHNDELNTLEYSETNKLNHQDVISILNSLESNEKVIKIKKSVTKLTITQEGLDFIESGSHEYQIYKAIGDEGSSLDDLKKINKIGVNKAKAMQWIDINKNLVTRKVTDVVDGVSEDLRLLQNGDVLDSSKLKEYKSRKLVKEIVSAYFIVQRGARFAEEDDNTLVSVLDETTLEQLSQDLSGVRFKPFNLIVQAQLRLGALHPLLKVRSEYFRILTQMGFQEMATNNYVESSFWNFDALFQPQDHPARDAHDTFFLQEPATSRNFPPEYMHRVSQVHSHGGYGSQGYSNLWRETEACKNVLRTHTTAASARMLHKLASECAAEFRPARYFSIDRVFRNESLDATHLAEFHQVEGLIADRGLNLGHLKKVIGDFFRLLGYTSELRFKPAYNPYTEPSMEIFGYHAGLGRWIELGNSGMFRPEMLLPMGLPEDVNVIAWGLSLERPTMIKYGIDNIRDLMGPKVDLAMVQRSPICRLDK